MNEHLKAAAEAARVAAMANVPWRIKREWLNTVTWYATLPDPADKMRQRYATPDFLATRQGQHEHVVPRAWLRDAILERPDEAETILALAVACNVTKAEHDRLTAVSDAFGWQRYVDSNLRVVDTKHDVPVELPELARGQLATLESLGLSP